ncbi:MAG: membrane dipeptidase [Pseudoxanthomonas sp.]
MREKQDSNGLHEGLSRRRLLKAVGTLPVVAGIGTLLASEHVRAGPVSKPRPDVKGGMSAPELIRRSLTWDNHGALTLEPFEWDCLPKLARYHDAGFDVVFLNIGYGEQGIEQHVRMLAHLRGWLAGQADRYVVIRSVEDIARAKQSGRLAVGFDIEGANGIADQPSMLQLYYDLGVRWMLLAYNRNNRVGGGCLDEDTGLTPYGRQVLEEMARIGMVVCCSHTGYRTSMDVLTSSPNPVIFSHSNPRAVYDHPRNIPDPLMRACAATGGVVGINGVGIFLGNNDASTETMVRHIDYAVQLIGPEHVGLGLDYMINMREIDEYLEKMKATLPPGHGYERGIQFVEPERLEQIVERLLQLGYDEAAMTAILGGNWLRVARQVWKPESTWVASEQST